MTLVYRVYTMAAASVDASTLHKMLKCTNFNIKLLIAALENEMIASFLAVYRVIPSQDNKFQEIFVPHHF